MAEGLWGPLEGVTGALVTAHWPGPLTVVHPPQRELSDHLCSQLGVGVRVSAHPVAGGLADAAATPVTCTSANVSGKRAAMSAAEVETNLGHGVDVILTGDPGGNPPSTVIRPWAWGVEVLRKGPVAIDPQLQVTRDTVLRGRLSLLQPGKGYRFAVDSLLVADFLAQEEAGRDLQTRLGLDLGTGCGVVALAVWFRLAGVTLVGVEIQPRLAALAALNVVRNGAADRVTICNADGRARTAPFKSESFDFVVSNPPFRPVGRGRASPDAERERALSERDCNLEDLSTACARLLRTNGRAVVIHAAPRVFELQAVFAARGLAVEKIRFVHPHAGRPARRVLVMAVKTPAHRAPEILDPLVMHEPDGRDTHELARIVGDLDRQSM